MTPALLFGPVGIEIVIVLLVIAILVGTNRLTGMMESAGQAFGAYNKTRNEVQSELDEFQSELDEAQSEIQPPTGDTPDEQDSPDS